MNTILTPTIWSALAAEYLSEPALPSIKAWLNARHLGDYIAGEVAELDNARRLTFEATHWFPVQNSEPYSDLDSMRRAWRDDAVVQVSDLYHDHPVWDRVDNLRFRVWHDTGHILTGNDFTPDGELTLFAHQARQLDERCAEALFSESVYQLAACIHLGAFPDVQHVRTPGPVGRHVLGLLLAL